MSQTGLRTEASFKVFDRRAKAGERLNVVFLGGSLTWGACASDPQRTSYRALMGQYLRERYPRCPFVFVDAAIGGVGSQLGMFRLERDVLSNSPDLVFLDFTINDDPTGQDTSRLASYESILHRLVACGVPVMQVMLGVSSFFGEHYAPMDLPRYQAHLKLAAAYGTGVGDTLPHIQQQVATGNCVVAEVWPFDPTHPDDAGYRLYFEAVRAGFQDAVAQGRVCGLPPTPVISSDYFAPGRIRLVDRDLPDGWHRAKTYRTAMWFDGQSSRWMDDVAVCDAADSEQLPPLRINFSGTFVGLFGEMDQDGLSFEASIDGVALLDPEAKQDGRVWTANTRAFTHGGVGRLYFWKVLASRLKPGEHTLEIRAISPGTRRGQLRIESVCVAGGNRTPTPCLND